jgi:hypothetical protein
MHNKPNSRQQLRQMYNKFVGDLHRFAENGAGGEVALQRGDPKLTVTELRALRKPDSPAAQSVLQHLKNRKS